MNPPVSNTVDGDMVTTWRRFAAVTIVKPAEVPTLTDPLLLPTQRRLYRRMVVAGMVVVAANDVELWPDKGLECLYGKLFNHLYCHLGTYPG